MEGAEMDSIQEIADRLRDELDICTKEMKVNVFDGRWAEHGNYLRGKREGLRMAWLIAQAELEARTV